MAFAGYVELDGGAESLNFMIDHVFLPPRLPQEDDTNPQGSLDMVRFLYNSVLNFLMAESISRPAVTPALEMLGRFLETNGPNETLDKQILRDIIINLKSGGTYSVYCPPCRGPRRLCF
jgi:hypothetical protein